MKLIFSVNNRRHNFQFVISCTVCLKVQADDKLFSKLLKYSGLIVKDQGVTVFFDSLNVLISFKDYSIPIANRHLETKSMESNVTVFGMYPANSGETRFRASLKCSYSILTLTVNSLLKLLTSMSKFYLLIKI